MNRVVAPAAALAGVTGRLCAPHTLQLEGSYAPGAGWNIRVEAENPDALRLVMDHVYPPHGAYPVVIAEYRRR